MGYIKWTLEQRTELITTLRDAGMSFRTMQRSQVATPAARTAVGQVLQMQQLTSTTNSPVSGQRVNGLARCRRTVWPRSDTAPSGGGPIRLFRPDTPVRRS